ncbi:unnamed protein product [Brassica rapa subsp. trilocularis]
MYPSVCVECIVVEAVTNASWFFPWMHLETTVLHRARDTVLMEHNKSMYGMPYEYSVYISQYFLSPHGTLSITMMGDIYSKHIQPCPFDVNMYCSKSITSFLPPLSLASDSPIT